jgi:acetyl esterase
VLSIAYRLAPEAPYPAALDDAVAAFRWLRERAPALDLSPDHLAIGGDSAGGNLATCCCLRLQELGEPGPAGQVLVYPAVDDTFDRPSWRRYADAPGLTAADARWCWQQYLGPAAGRPAAPFAAPMRAPSLRGLPPALVLTATVDPLRDDVDAYAERLRADGVPVIAKRYPGVFHGFFTEVRTFDRARKAVADVAAFLRELVG